MAVNYLVDRPVRQGTSGSDVEAALTTWLAQYGAPLASGVYGNVRVDWRARSAGTGDLRARLTLVDDERHEDWVWYVDLTDLAGRIRVERTQTSPHLLLDAADLKAPVVVKDLVATDPEAAVLPQVLVSVSDPVTNQQERLLAEMGTFLSGMALVIGAPAETVASAASGARLACDGRPGSVVFGPVGEESPIVVPATVALRDPAATGKRVQQALLTRLDLALPVHWVALEAELNSESGGDVDAVLDELAQEQQGWVSERQGLLQEIQDLQLDAIQMAEDVADYAEEIDQLRSRLRLFERELAKHNAYPTEGPAEDELDILPSTMSDTIILARELLPQLVITASMDPIAKLDHHESTQGWAHTFWTILRGLNDYARVVSDGSWRGSLVDYCKSTPPGLVGIPFKKVAMLESEPTMNNPACRAARMFSVPDYVSSSGMEVMFPHIKISRTSPAPRAHFLDRVADAGKLVIGYVGPHLPTAG